MAHMTKPRREVLDLLEANGGTIIDPSGRASSLINEMLPGPTRSTVGMNSLLRSMEEAGLLRREIRAKRTFSISLVDDMRPPRLQPAPPVVNHQTPTNGQVAHTNGALNYHELADAMLNRVGEILRMDPEVHEGTIRELKEEMAAAYEEAGVLRTELAQERDVSDRLRRDRKRLQEEVVILEANINAMLKGVRNDRGEAAFRAVERFMQQRPLTRAS